MPSRPVNSEAINNGCLNPVAWNQYYNFNVCIASTCEVSDYAIERSDRYARQGNSSIRFFLKPTPLDKWPLGEATHRAELGPRYEAPINRYPKEGEERWYGMSVLMPEDFVFAPPNLENELRFSIAQWQHGSEGSPALALEVYGNKLAIARSVGESVNSTWVEPQFIGEITPGKWIDLIIQVKWAKKDGIIRAWYNGKKTYDHKDIQTVYENLSVGGGLKLGIYYWRWRDKDSVRQSLENGINNREIFIDEVREFIGPEGKLVVTPGQSF
ncbi:MAG: polysaccharide lyase [Saprospiraceae bacterium]|nr:polysaccharide lyase [Saprospiraceae bacterium]